MLGKIIDLSLDIYDKAPSMPLDPKCSISSHFTLDTLGLNLNRLTMSSHHGTHLDAPYHFNYEGTTIDKLDFSQCIVRAIKIDLTYKKAKEEITVEDLKKYESYADQGLSLVLDTGWYKQFPQDHYFSDFPCITIELAEWFAMKKVPIVGLDFPAPHPDDWKAVHQIMLSKNSLLLEGLTNLEALGDKEFTLFALPLKIRGGDGSPVRAIAMED